MNKEQAIKLLNTHKRDRFAWPYAFKAIDNLNHGFTMLACEECKSGHFVVGHDGDKTFLPVRIWLEDMLSNPPKAPEFTVFVDGRLLMCDTASFAQWIVQNAREHGAEIVQIYSQKPT